MADYAACSNRACPDRNTCWRAHLADNTQPGEWQTFSHFNRNRTQQLGFDCYIPKEEMTCAPATSVPAS